MTDHRRDGIEYPDDQELGSTVVDIEIPFPAPAPDPLEGSQEPPASEEASEGDDGAGEPETAAQPSEAVEEKSTATT